MSTGTIITFVACGVSILALLNTILRNTKNDSQQDGTVLTEIGYIKSSVDDVKKKLDKQDERYLELSTRLTVVEQSSKSAHKRIDDIVKGENS